MACVAVLSLMRTMELEFLQTHPRPILQQNQLLIPPNIDFIHSLLGKLQFLIELFDENRMDDVEAIKILETRLRDVAFRTEDEIELQVVHLYQEEERLKRDTRGRSMLSLRLRHILQQAIEDIDAIKEEVVKVKEEYELSKDLHGRNAALHVLPKPADDEVITMASHSQEIMVGKQDEFEIIKEKLIQHPSKQLEVVSIKGMGGIGKTTLAKKIYEDPLITSYFDKQVWIVASQHHNKRQMLLDLLGSKGDADKSDDGDLALLLYQSFKKCQRYLVVMDDVWSVEAWYAVKSCFPDDGNGSRVLLTTRLAEVANHTCSKDDFSHQMQLLEQSEGWKLFNEKACKSRGAEFETIGRPVVEKCKGLPLVIIVVAGLFSKLNTLDEWISTANALSSSSATTLDDEECLRILSLSYNHLPHNLKACFLHLGVFPEDHEIRANNLARLWLAEGFVKTFENENFDAVANRYMQELMDRNLIILRELCSRGRKVKRFRMHDLLHAFCVKEAQKENLLHVVMSENRSDFPPKGFRWVSIQSVNLDMSAIRSQTKSCRSFFNFLLDGSSLKFKDFNLLRILYSPMNGKLSKVVVLKDIVHLRFIRWEKDIKLSRARGFLKSRCRKGIELSRSWNLQTLNCPGIVSYRSNDCGNYSEFQQLHYIHCTDYIHGNPSSFVHTLYSISANDCSQEYIKNIPFLRKVGIACNGRDDYNGCITNLATSEQLEVLRFVGNRRDIQTPITNHIVNLKNLRKVSLEFMLFCSEEINILSKLPKLEVLKLQLMLFSDEEWKIEEEVIFCRLISLQFLISSFKHWKASSSNFPKLEHLCLCECRSLREIPIDFAEISTLKSIILERCLPSAVESARKIQDVQRDYGNDNMVVTEEYTRHDLESKKSLREEEPEVEN